VYNPKLLFSDILIMTNTSTQFKPSNTLYIIFKGVNTQFFKQLCSADKCYLYVTFDLFENRDYWNNLTVKR